MNKPLASQLRDLARQGGCIIVNADDYMASQMREIAMYGKVANSKLIIKKAGRYLLSQCADIARENPGNVFFDFT